MKNRLLVVFLLFVAALVVTSCYSSRKQGCPMVNGNYKFKG